MSLNKEINEQIKERVKSILKLEKRIQEKNEDIESGDNHVFLMNLFGKDAILLAKVVKSLETSLGMSFYEQVTKLIGESIGYEVETQEKLYGFLNKKIEDKVLKPLEKMDYEPNRKKEIKEIRKISKEYNLKNGKHEPVEYPDSTVDVYITKPDGVEILIDITSVKLNKKEFRVLKQKMLRWTAYRMSQDPEVQIETYFAIPYNPEGKTITDTNYNRWGDYYDRGDILVGDEFWKKISNNNCSITDIVKIFRDIGAETEDLYNKLNLDKKDSK